MKYYSVITIVCLSLLLFAACKQKEQGICLIYPENNPQLDFSIEKVTQSLDYKEYKRVDGENSFVFEFKLNEDLGKQAYSFKPLDNGVIIEGGDFSGLMYAGFELAEQIRLFSSVHDIKNLKDTAYIKRRGIKFNIPLDARTPGYDDTGDAAQKNIAEMWNMEFWIEFLDNMAIHRYNALTLWNPHPFPVMTKLESYPDVALNDVYVTNVIPTGKPDEWNEPQLLTKEVYDNCRVVRKMSIDEKINFWKDVMQHARNRGIEVYIITWNICPNSVALPRENHVPMDTFWTDEPKGKYGINHQINNIATRNYYREAVKQLVLTYPDLTGIGVTAGELMPDESNSGFDKEQWLWDTYGMGILDAKKEQPDRNVRFIHRMWWTDMKDIMKYWKNYPDDFEMSFKYSRARLFSSVKPPFAENLLISLKEHNLKSWWNLRNDDIFVHRWGDPDYVRALIHNFTYAQTAGFHMGSDGYVWGREFISMDTEINGELEIVKHWYNFMLWGRLGFNPGIKNERFIEILDSKFKGIDADLLDYCWKNSSKIIPLVNCFHWRDWDWMWSVEGCIDMVNYYRNVNMFRTNETMEGSNIINIVDYVNAFSNGERVTQTTPLQVADSLQFWSENALFGIQKIKDNAKTTELKQTCLDIESMSYLGLFYAYKIRGATDLEFYKGTGEMDYKEKALANIENAINYWKKYAEINSDRYHTQMLARTNSLDWYRIFKEVEKDKDIVRNEKPY